MLPLSILAVLLLLPPPLPAVEAAAAAASSAAAKPSVSTGYNCSTDRSIYPCQSYAFYRAGADPSLLNLSSIGDLFGVSGLSIARASNLSAAAALTSGQPLLVPLECNCGATGGNRSYAPVAFQIASGDTYYGVSTTKLENLTAYPAVEAVNPTLVATNLPIGVMVVFPIFCKCPAQRNTTAGGGVPGLSSGLVTYVFQPSDTFAAIASSFGTDVQSLISINGAEKSIQPYATIFVPVSQVPPPILLSHNSTGNSTTTTAAAVVIERRERKGVVVGLGVGLGVMGMVVVALICVIWRGGSRRRVKGDENWGKGAEKRYGRSKSDDKLMADISEWLDKYRLFGMEELVAATLGFDKSRLIEGSVYKGVIEGDVYAVKKMKWNACDELKILQKVNHTNLVKLEGFCIEPDAGTCYLVYEYIQNGSLHYWLHDPSAPYKLDWRTRLRVALDLANGLQYIHEHTWPRVVHKDIKSSNVLLDDGFRAKIANFGLARTGCNAVTTHIVGTQGYIAPEYLIDGLVTTKMDVFAYGVVLLELVSGRDAADAASGDALWMAAEAAGVFGGRDRLMEWMDEALLGEEQMLQVENVVNVMNIAKACLNRDPAKRPSMVDVAYTLSKGDDLFSDFSEDGVAVENGSVSAR